VRTAYSMHIMPWRCVAAAPAASWSSDVLSRRHPPDHAVLLCRCHRELMATRLRPARQPPSQHTTSRWPQLLQQVLLQWPLSSVTRLPCGLTADLNGGVGTRPPGHMLAVRSLCACVGISCQLLFTSS
jgi:hypothetical protein